MNHVCVRFLCHIKKVFRVPWSGATPIRNDVPTIEKKHSVRSDKKKIDEKKCIHVISDFVAICALLYERRCVPIPSESTHTFFPFNLQPTSISISNCLVCDDQSVQMTLTTETQIRFDGCVPPRRQSERKPMTLTVDGTSKFRRR